MNGAPDNVKARNCARKACEQGNSGAEKSARRRAGVDPLLSVFAGGKSSAGEAIQ